jgi:predicted nucleic acid-binding protein
MIVVSNTTPLIGLACIGKFELLHKLFGEIHIPKAVYNEAVVTGREEGGAKREVSGASWIKTVSIQDRLAVDVLLDELDLGEAEAIVLASEIKADWVLMDEKKGRRKLAQLGMPKVGTVGILLKAKQVGLLSVVRPELEKLRQRGFSLSQSVIDTVLQQANE